MSHHGAPLPALRNTAPAYACRAKRKSGGNAAKNAYSLDGFLSSTQPRAAAAAGASPLQGTASSTLPTSLPRGPNGQSSTWGSNTAATAVSPAEALLTSDDAGSPAPAALPPSQNVDAWRSGLLQCEAQLRELVARGVQEPPTLQRTLQVLDLYDQVTGSVQVQQGNTFVAQLLRLFRLEFCRAIFLDSSSVDSMRDVDRTTGKHASDVPYGAALDDGLPHTYFEETASLQRAKAALTNALAHGASGESLWLLERQLEEKGEQLGWYESELERVRRQYDQVADECVQLRTTQEEMQRDAAAVQRKLQQELQTLHVENKDLQLQLFRLRKQMAGGKSNLLKDSYRQLKLRKMQLTQSLFNEGDERVALLVLLGQVENRVNEILDAYDDDFVLTPESGHRELQLKMADAVAVLLEDMHYCEASYRRLVGTSHMMADASDANENASNNPGIGRGSVGNSVGRLDQGSTSGQPKGGLQRIPLGVVHTGKDDEAPDESDGYVAILFDHRIYEHFHRRHLLQARVEQFRRDQKDGHRHSHNDDSDEAGQLLGARKAGTKGLGRSSATSALLSGMFAAESLLSRRGTDVDGPLGGVAAATVAGPPLPDRSTLDREWSLDSHTLVHGSGAPLPPSSPPEALEGQTSWGAKLSKAASRGRAAAKQVVTHSQLNAPQQENGPSSPSAEVPEETLEEAVERRKAEWVAHILGPSASSITFTVPGREPEKGDVVVVHEASAEVVPAELMMRRVLHHPLEDLCNERFLSTVELFTGQDPVQQRLLCRINHLDPSVPVQVPDSTNFVKVKYALAKNAVMGSAGAASAVSAPVGTAAAPASTAPAAAAGGSASEPAVFRGNPQLRLFKELSSKSLVANNPGLQYRAGAVSSTTATTVAFQRLHPMSPNRPPEWQLYQQLFGPYRSLTPRMIDVTTIDHVMSRACERFFTRMEYRYDECFVRAGEQCTNHQLRRDMTEQLFKDLHELSDFQEALVDELEARYGYPELVAKTLYEMLCYLDAVEDKDSVLAAYLEVVRGFSPPTQVHFMAYMLYHLSFCWPSADPSAAVPVEDVRTVLEYVYRNAGVVVSVQPETILSEYDLSTRSAPLNFVNMRQFMASSMVHLEEPILMHLHGLFHSHTQRELVDEATWETYDAVISRNWRETEEQRSRVRYLTTTLGVNRTASPTLPQLALLAASAWSSHLWE